MPKHDDDSFKVYARFEKSKEDPKLFYGIATSTDVDRDDERMSPKLLRKFSEQLKGKPVLFNHDPSRLALGVITESYLNEDGKQAFIKMRATEAEGAKDFVKQLDEGILNSFSIGGRPIHKTPIMENGKQTCVEIDDADAYEVSAVYMPSNVNAKIMGRIAKSLSSEAASEHKVHPWLSEEEARRVVADHHAKEGDKMGDEMGKDVGPQTPNEPMFGKAKVLNAYQFGKSAFMKALGCDEMESEDEGTKKYADAKPAPKQGENAPMQPSKAEKAVDVEDLKKSVREELAAEFKKEFEELKKELLTPKGLATDPKDGMQKKVEVKKLPEIGVDYRLPRL